jgi:hypothetical protein
MRIVALLGVVVVAVVSSMAPVSAMAAGKFDGSTSMVCVPIVVTECGPEGECKRVTAEAVNLPQFLKVDVKAMKVQSEETGRDAPFKSIERSDGSLILQGGQAGRGWTMTIDEATGKMSATISSHGEGFIVFGACMLQP